ncbi:MAG: hypothetical protein VYD71_01120 [Bacteroidota bacterium]|nr:hypothetical protein [Bacteroidota bacterium]
MKKYLLLALLLLTFSCKKDEATPEFRISLINTTPTTLQEFQENVLVTITYQHPEGFLGFTDPDYLSIEIHDSRLTNPDYYHLQPLAPPNENISIQGEINVEIDSPFRFGNGNSETLTYSLRIQDNNKNWSNTIVTPTITVNK